ncbi:PorP/SprF family type IX secretion system membrane protein [Aureispira anguillae]|uniref:PorP/SprF family type IX secretion system membrane protein n=1 Tax=Aureispira anguillae TaxID=2864201 RepID=A0A915YAT9_9BACT|nr:PorP/SprF family type IX secretion system membrane protein [Aureispira anguillae]BDS09646.1 PorP/SprF family type IX secretion system membrane protein [Aureispira anguillae]
MKLGKFFTFIIIAVIANLNPVQGQDVHFSQFYVSNLTLNPATTGVMSCQMRVSAIYRNQWASAAGQYAFNTFGLGAEGKFNAGKHDYVGAGLSVWVDRAGASAFTSIQASLSGSYMKKIGGRRSNEHYLVAGGQFGFVQRSIRIDQLRWGSNWDGTNFNGSLPDNESVYNSSLAVADLSAGLLWFSALDKDNKSNVYAGIGFQHLTKANLSFMNPGSEPLFTRFTIHGGAEARLARRLAIVPNFAVMVQGPSTQLNVGTGLKFDFSKRAQSNQAFTIGAYVRGANHAQVNTGTNTNTNATFGVDAIIALLRLRFGSSSIGLSYDINVSQLAAATNGNGAFELSYVWTLCQKRGRRLGCPTF